MPPLSSRAAVAVVAAAIAIAGCGGARGGAAGQPLTQILSIQLGVKTDMVASKSFAFCISALTALRD